MKYFLLFIFISVYHFANAQEGTVKINIDPKLEQLIEKRNEQKKIKGTISGYRVQIYFGSSRTEANDAKTKFTAIHPELESYLIYQQPYFKVRAGDFRTRFEAYKLYKEIQKEFSSVFIVQDEINFPKLANSQ
jgi:hypothetical protein